MHVAFITHIKVITDFDKLYYSTLYNVLDVEDRLQLVGTHFRKFWFSIFTLRVLFLRRSVVSYRTLTKPLHSFETLNAASGGEAL